MDPILFTPRLKLTLVTSAPRGSREFDWIHELRSDPQATFYSLHRTSQSPEDTEKQIQRLSLTPETTPPEGSDVPIVPKGRSYRVNYAVHELLSDNPSTTTDPTLSTDQRDAREHQPSRFIGMINLSPRGLDLPVTLFSKEVHLPSTLAVELGYSFLPASWGKGFASEALSAMLSACRDVKNRGFWIGEDGDESGGYEKIYLRAIVNAENPASQKVLQKCGVEKLGMYTWEGDAIYLMGRWTTKSDLWIFGTWIVE